MVRLYEVILLVALIFSVFVCAYRVKNSTILLMNEEESILRQIDHEENQIQKLRTEYAYLTSPSYIQFMLDKYNNILQLAPIDPSKVVSVDELIEKIQKNNLQNKVRSVKQEEKRLIENRDSHLTTPDNDVDIWQEW